MRRAVMAAAGAAAVAAAIVWRMNVHAPERIGRAAAPPPQIPATLLAAEKGWPQVRVAVFGGSIAAGWDDNEGGYINRALRALSANDRVRYTVVRQAVPGMAIGQMSAKFTSVLEKYRPGLVILSWGGLNDAVNKTPVPTFGQDISAEISAALARRAAVLVVTPPVTAAAYIDGRHAVPYLYFAEEMKVARAFHSPNVTVCDVYDEMMRYLKEHHLSYKPFEADGWHPNVKGHALAGQLLAEDLIRQFGARRITFTN